MEPHTLSLGRVHAPVGMQLVVIDIDLVMLIERGTAQQQPVCCKCLLPIVGSNKSLDLHVDRFITLAVEHCNGHVWRRHHWRPSRLCVGGCRRQRQHPYCRSGTRFDFGRRTLPHSPYGHNARYNKRAREPSFCLFLHMLRSIAVMYGPV
jgi:hypothetical protein